MNKPKKWTEVYPYGTKEGDDEAKFFRAIARHKKYEYRSIPAIVKDTGLTRERVEEIIDKYVNKIQPPLIYAHKTTDDNWGYWERCINDLPSDFRNLSNKDKDSRIDKHMNGLNQVIDTSDMTANSITTQIIGAPIYPLDLIFNSTVELKMNHMDRLSQQKILSCLRILMI